MFHIALHEPEIPPNTGILFDYVHTGSQLHLIHPMGFSINDKTCRRAGLDYQEYASIQEHESVEDFLSAIDTSRLFLCTTKATQHHSTPAYQSGDTFLLGPESRGLPETLLDNFPFSQKIRIPMLPNSRSLNLSNATAVIAYEAWRQCDFTV